MKNTEKLFKTVQENRLVALLAPDSPDHCLAAYEVFHPAGITLEVAMRSAHALDGIRLVLKKHPDALLLAGTVMDQAQADAALKDGVSGIVSADYIPEVVELCAKKDVLCIPGGLGDAGKQLVHKAKVYGCSLEELKTSYPYQWIYKLFPACTGTNDHTDLPRAWRGPFKDLIIMYAGGITLENVSEIAAKDSKGIFCASALCRNLSDAGRLQDDIACWKAALEPPVKMPPKEPGPKARIVTFGELMARLSPPKGIRLEQAGSLDLCFGGAEANVAVSLARFGLAADFITALPDNDVGDNARNALRAHGVGTDRIERRGSRIGIYYLEHGVGPRPSKVVYDRLPSAFSEITKDTFDWDRILDGAGWFHFTGITPALGDNVAACLIRALRVAKQKGLTVSADLNYRNKLWSRQKAEQVMSDLMPFVDILIANEEDPTSVFNIQPPDTDVEKGKLSAEGYEKVASDLIERFGCDKVAITLRESISASENRWAACLHNGKAFLLSRTYHVWIVDRVGAGDAFAAGLIYGILEGKSDEDALNFGTAASCLKHTVAGDFNLHNTAEVERLARGSTSGRVQR